MEIDITGRKIEITPAIRKFVDGQMQRAAKFIPYIQDASLTLTVQKYRQIAELNIHTKNSKYKAVYETDDMYAAINTVFDKIIKQGRRRKRKLIGLHRKEKVERQQLLSEEIDESVGETKIIPYEGFSLKPMNIDEASVNLGRSSDLFMVFRNASNERINILYKRKDGNHGLIEPEK